MPARYLSKGTWRYIHLNPLRGGLVENLKELDQYRWRGHGLLMNQTKQAWENIKSIYELFGDNKRKVRKKYKNIDVPIIPRGAIWERFNA